MNRRRLPQENPPEEYDTILKQSKVTESLNTLPPELSSEDIEQLNILKLKIKSYTYNNNNNNLNSSLTQIIDYLDDDVAKNLNDVVLFVMWKLERFILKKDAGTEKRKLAIGILKKLFHDDENITGLYIDSLMKELKQVKTFGRIILKIWRYFAKNE